MRAFTAAYLVLKYGNRCFHRTEYCFMGDQPFEHPERANFDHIDGNNHNHTLGNLRVVLPVLQLASPVETEARTLLRGVREKNRQ